MREFLMALIAIIICLSSLPVYSSQTHTNVLRKMIMETPLDLWAGKPDRAYTVLANIEAGGQAGQEGMYDYVRNVLNNLMKQAIVLEANAIIDLKCSGKAYPEDQKQNKTGVRCQRTTSLT
jgi:putative cell wall-binding protein